jgi:hypothetical protein
MLTTLELLNRVKAAYSLDSDYALAKKLGISKQSVSYYYNKGSTLNDKTAFVVADLLELNPAYVVACSNMERAERQEDSVGVSFWMRYALTSSSRDNLSQLQPA